MTYTRRANRVVNIRLWLELRSVKRRLLLLVLLGSVPFLMSGLAQDADTSEQYICVADMSTGFVHDDTRREWGSTDFNVDNHQYVVSDRRHGIGSQFTVTLIGYDVPAYTCEEGFGHEGTLVCRDPRQSSNAFRFNKHTRRFLSSDISHSYADSDQSTDSAAASAGIAIGRCSPF